MIGPFVFGFMHNVNNILHFSEIGVVFLMFLIGLELKPSKLWELRRFIFSVGTAQVVITATIMAGLLFLAKFSWQAAVVRGLRMAMSSTAMALQLINEKGCPTKKVGSLVSLFYYIQDMAVIPIVALIPLLAEEELAHGHVHGDYGHDHDYKGGCCSGGHSHSHGEEGGCCGGEG